MHHLLLLALSLAYQAPATEPAPNDGADVIVTENRSFKIPVHLAPADRKQVSEVRVFVSTDGGQTWTKEAKLSVGTESLVFSFMVRGPGLYCFSAQTVSRDGKLNPEDLTKEPPQMKVRVIDPIKKAP